MRKAIQSKIKTLVKIFYKYCFQQALEAVAGCGVFFCVFAKESNAADRNGR